MSYVAIVNLTLNGTSYSNGDIIDPADLPTTKIRSMVDKGLIDYVKDDGSLMSGTGSPQGVVTAPVGSIWHQTDSTVGVTHWRKATGTGNTGWVVMAGDTGWRNVTPINGWTCNNMWIRRYGSIVQFAFWSMSGSSATSSTFYSLPDGFKGMNNQTGMYATGQYNSTGSTVGMYRMTGSGNWTVSSATYTTALSAGAALSVTWIADEYSVDIWPATLPGSS